MKLETFFEKFELFAEAPNAVERMRELILELAVRGKLLEQADHPPSGMGSVEPEKNKKIPTKIEPTAEPLFSIPQSWKWTRLASLGDMNPRNSARDLEKSSFVPMALISAEYGKKNSQQERLWGEIKKGYTHFMNGDVVMAKITPCFENGKSCVMSGLTGGIGAGTTELHVFRPDKSKVIPGYVIIYLKSRGFIERGIPKMTGSAGQKRIPSSYFLESPFPIPPLSEQKGIVAKVDELMTLCDRLESQQNEREARRTKLARASLARFSEFPTRTNLGYLFHHFYDIKPGDLRKSILTLAVRGKLISQKDGEGDARIMIDRAMQKRQQTIRTKNLRRKEIDQSINLFKRDDLPSSWCVERFANLVDPENTISYGVLVPGNNEPDGIPFVRAQDLRLSDHPVRPNKTISPEIEKPYARTRLTGGEILLCVVGSIGKLGVVPDSWAGANIARAVARIKPIPDILRDYLLLVLQEQSVQNYFISTTRTLAQPTLNVGMIEQTPIPVPPIGEQARIVEKVAQLMALTDQLEAQLSASQTAVAKLLEAIATELTMEA